MAKIMKKKVAVKAAAPVDLTLSDDEIAPPPAIGSVAANIVRGNNDDEIPQSSALKKLFLFGLFLLVILAGVIFYSVKYDQSRMLCNYVYQSGDVLMVETLLFIEKELNGTVETLNENGATPLQISARYNPDVAVTALIINAGANINAKDKNGKSVRDYAKENPNAETAKALQKLVMKK